MKNMFSSWFLNQSPTYNVCLYTTGTHCFYQNKIESLINKERVSWLF